jgi:hypothetical protein
VIVRRCCWARWRRTARTILRCPAAPLAFLCLFAAETRAGLFAACSMLTWTEAAGLVCNPSHRRLGAPFRTPPAHTGVVSIFACIRRFAGPGAVARFRNSSRNPSLGHHLTANTYKSDGRRRSLWATAQKARQIRRNLFSKRLYDALVGIPMHIITLLVVSVLVGWLSTLILLSDLDNLSARFRHWRNGRSVGRRAVGSSPCGISTARSTAWCCQERSYRGSAP